LWLWRSGAILPFRNGFAAGTLGSQTLEHNLSGNMGSRLTKDASPTENGTQTPPKKINYVLLEEMNNFFIQKCANMTPPFIPDDLMPLLKSSSPGVWIADPNDASHSLYRSASEVRCNTRWTTVFCM
jgi:hypothetical protein